MRSLIKINNLYSLELEVDDKDCRYIAPTLNYLVDEFDKILLYVLSDGVPYSVEMNYSSKIISVIAERKVNGLITRMAMSARTGTYILEQFSKSLKEHIDQVLCDLRYLNERDKLSSYHISINILDRYIGEYKSVGYMTVKYELVLSLLALPHLNKSIYPFNKIERITA